MFDLAPEAKYIISAAWRLNSLSLIDICQTHDNLSRTGYG
ncbi:Uncharacterised protein [Trueperella bialowiezensis]|uniref:Uncharacterized protein n=1 Tax=Trueperella bialowiezensis TaxID=312285 RepID=A0A448PCF0_9ACTO|nr:Uncharacterised protein [Trueperella bialowiezensis]